MSVNSIILKKVQKEAFVKFGVKHNYKDDLDCTRIDFRDGSGSCFMYTFTTYQTTYGSGYCFSFNTLHGFKHERCNNGGHNQWMRSEPKVVNEFLDLAKELKLPGFEIIKDSDYMIMRGGK